MKPNLTKYPKTDYNYNADTLAGLNSRCAKRVATAHSFREISEDYFKNEEPRSYVSEAALFAVIVMTVAVALASNVNALHHFVRAIGAI